MAQGGARVRPGPPPSPYGAQARADEWTVLPAGPSGVEAPPWPLPYPLKREKALWVQLWDRPQARMWLQLHLEGDVALYVRRFVECESRGSKVDRSTITKQLGDALGMSVPGLRANRWKVEGGPVPEAAAAAPVRASSRSRLRSVPATTDGA